MPSDVGAEAVVRFVPLFDGAPGQYCARSATTGCIEVTVRRHRRIRQRRVFRLDVHRQRARRAAHVLRPRHGLPGVGQERQRDVRVGVAFGLADAGRTS